MSRAHLSFLFSLILTANAFAEHGGTSQLEKESEATRKRFAGKILNENLPVFWAKDGGSVAFHFEIESGKREWHLLDLKSGEVSEIEKKPEGYEPSPKEPQRTKPEKPALISKNSAKSPDESQKVSFRDGAVFIGDTKRSQPLPDGWKWDENRVLWSPDSSRFAAFKRPMHPVREVHYVESSPEDSLQPKHSTISYPKAGDDLNIAVPVIFFVDEREAIEAKPELIETPFDLRNFGWRGDSRRFVFEFIERGFGKFRVIEWETETGRQRILIDETDEKFVFVFGNTFRRDLNGADEILWLSERDGWNHLYLIDGKSGEVIRQLTSGKWVVREVVDVNESTRTALIKISGFYPEQDPYYLHFAILNLDDGTVVHLTDADGTHEIFPSPDGQHYLAKWSRVDHPPVFEIRRFSDGKKIATIAEASGLDALSQLGWQMPQRFVTKDRNNEFDIHGVIFRPTDFDSKKRYPVIEAIYAGPHGAFTPKTWQVRHGVMAEMADAGFIVVKLDGLGTNYRGRKFQQIAYQNLIDSGFPDRRKWITEAAKVVPQMDLKRVGIYGGSAGGQSALAGLLTHPDFYQAGAADCGCHDNRMDKIWWNEQWMDWPVGPAYAANSNVTHIEKLTGALLLTVGELDKNVDPSSTMQVVNALIKADKDFEFIIVPGAGHGVGEKPYLRRKRIEFFQQHLGLPK